MGMDCVLAETRRKSPVTAFFVPFSAPATRASSSVSTKTEALATCNSKFVAGKDNRISYGRKTEEYIADFCLVSKNALTSLEYDIFRFHYLLGADWKLCSWRLQLDRGTFFHLIYKIEQKLGRVFRELQPHSLFPLDEYFGGTMRNDRPAVALIPKPPSPHVLRPPIGLSAA